MTEKMIYEKVNEIFQDVFDDDTIRVVSSTTSADIDGWDSLVHVNLVVSIEKSFGIKFNMEEVSAMKNVGNMVNFISNYINK